MAQRHGEAAARLRELELESTKYHSAHLAIEERLLRLRAQVLMRDPAEALADAVAALARVPDMPLRQRISFNLLRAYQHHRQADHGTARRHLLVALRAAQAHKGVGVLLEDAQVLEPLLPVLIAEPGAEGASTRSFAAKLIARLRRLPGTGVRSRASGITRQEHRVLVHLADGGTNKEIARAMGLSESAVRFHLRNLFRKLKVARRAALLERARARGLLT